MKIQFDPKQQYQRDKVGIHFAEPLDNRNSRGASAGSVAAAME
jgi:hypothetical protein